MRKVRLALIGATLAVLVTAMAGPALSVEPLADTSQLRRAVDVGDMITYARKLQQFANENDGTRASGTPGYDRSAEFVFDQLRAAGYNVAYQPFEFAFFQQLAPSELQRISPAPETFTEGEDFSTMDYSGSGEPTAPLQAVDVVMPPGEAPNTSTSGCEDADFEGFVPGNIALIQRGTCFFATKALNAEEAGAVGVLIFNEGQPGRTDTLFGTLGGPGVTVPVFGISFALGEELYDQLQSGPVVMRMFASTVSETRETRNVIAETPGGDRSQVIMGGAHLDSVVEGPGINDNGSGSVALLETAVEFARLGIKPVNKVRFAWWAAEENGLVGSEYYVSQLRDIERRAIKAYLNFDMVGSPNYVRFVYDGDGSAFGLPGPRGSGLIERLFVDYFDSQGLATEPSPFNGRSDYGPFIAVGIPAGGLFTGAEGIKTPEQEAIYGGTAGVPYDRCYHQACDTISNVNRTVLGQMADGVAHVTMVLALREDLGVLGGPPTKAGDWQGHALAR